MNLESTVKSIAKVFNICGIKLQWSTKLSCWDNKKYTDEVIADVIGVNELTLGHARELILKRVAKAVEYI
ncbi:hypothetical protein [Staphylococcus sp. AS1337]|uniref:hypothetical protein n=1 Tax=Staphylococcus sp. AS1337 TaxID=3434042 RepID=UPI003F565D08